MKDLGTRYKISEGVKKFHREKRGGENPSHNARFDLTHRLWAQAVLARDKHVCQDCGGKAQVAHHIIEYNDNAALRYVVQNGKSMCRACHARVHWDHEKMAKSRARAKEIKEVKAKLADAKKYLNLIMQNPRFAPQNQNSPS